MKQDNMKGNRLRLHLPGLLATTLLATTLLSIGLLSGCTEADVLDGGGHGEQPGGKKVEATFALQVMPGKAPATRSITFTSRGSVVSDTLAMKAPASQPAVSLCGGTTGKPEGNRPDSLQTRAGDPGTDQERTISNVWVGQYDTTSGALLSQNYVTPVVADSVVLTLAPSTSCNIRFVTNAGNLGATDAPTATAIQTENGLLGLKLTTVTADGKLQNNLCVMTGLCARHDVPPTGFKKEEVTPVELTRLPAKLTFQYSVNTADGRFSFTPANVRVESVPGQLSQIQAPAGQLAGTIYTTTYTFPLTSSDQTKTIECYLPENMAGNGDAVASLKDRIGAGVQNATSIVLSGNAVQDGVSYSNVEIRFYPGDSDPAKLNNYDIERNGHYTMNITLGGLDFTDKRITIGTVPPLGPIPNLPAAKGATQQVQVTARPGMEWVFDLPVWLSAKLPGTTTPTDSITVPAGSKLSYKGPVNVNFKVTESNPRAEERQVSFPIPLGDQAGTTNQLVLKQDGSTLTVPGGDAPTSVNLGAATGSTGTFSFTATAGLPWDALFSNDLLDWSGTPALGGETTGAQETYTIVATYTNPSGNPRTVGTVTVRAGASVSDTTYTGLKREVPVVQAGSTFELVSPSNMTIEYNTTSFHVTIKGTKGLTWEVNSQDPTKQIAPVNANGVIEATDQNQNIAFAAQENTSLSRSKTFDITVPGGNHTKTVTVTQKAYPIITINQDVLTNYVKKIGTVLSSYPPFDIDGDGGSGIKNKHAGVEFTINGANSTMTGDYQIQVESEQQNTTYVYQLAKDYCNNLKEGGFDDWRLPTQIELYLMWDKAKGTNNDASDYELDSEIYGAKFRPSYYWGSSVYNSSTGLRCLLIFSNGNFDYGGTANVSYVRCVRDLN